MIYSTSNSELSSRSDVTSESSETESDIIEPSQSMLKLLHETKQSFDSNSKKRIDPDFVLKVVIIGDSAVGKSTLLDRYIDGKYDIEPKYISTIGVDLKVKTVNVPVRRSVEKIKPIKPMKPIKPINPINPIKPIELIKPMSLNTFTETVHSCKLQLWDTAGQEKFRSITRSYYKGTNIFILCFDSGKIIDEETIISIKKWMYDSKNIYYNDYSAIYVVGTKADTIVGDGLRSKIDSDKLVKSVNDFYKTSDFSHVTSSSNDFNGSNGSNGSNGFNTGENIHKHFIGMCSVTSNTFVPIDFNSGTNTKYNIDQMFDLIVKNYLENLDNDKFTKIKTKTVQNFSLTSLDKNNSRWCC
jgi:small GTP-binding protein